VLAGRTFRSLREPNYRRFFVGNAISVMGTWMQRVAQDWLVFTLSGSAVALGVNTALQFVPMLFFGLWAGVLVDRWDRRRILLVTQSLSAVLAALLWLLAISGVVELWMVYALTLVLGIITVLDQPARQTFVIELVDVEDYVNAQALNSTVANVGRLAGPAVAGILIATTGVSVAFLANALSFVAVLVSLMRMDRRALRRGPRLRRARGQTVEGLRYVWGRPRLTVVLLLVLVVGIFGQNFRVVLPVFAQGTFAQGAAGYGYLMAMVGLGAVIGSLFTASRTSVGGGSVLAACVAFGVTNLIAAVSPSISVAYVAMAALGFANIAFNTFARTLVVVSSDQRMHGRVLALHALFFLGSTPIGGPLLGRICEVVGARAGFAVAGGTSIAAVLLLLPVILRLRRAAVGAADRAAQLTDPVAPTGVDVPDPLTMPSAMDGEDYDRQADLRGDARPGGDRRGDRG
jgi:MFS family permease